MKGDASKGQRKRERRCSREQKMHGRGCSRGQRMHGRGCKERRRYLEVPAPHMKLASSTVPEGVGAQLPVEAGHDRVARGAVSVVKAVIGIQC